MWASLCEAIGRSELVTDPRFAHNRDRVENRESLERELTSAFASETVEHWCALLAERAVPVSPIRHLDEIYSDPHTAALGMVGTVDHPTLGPLKQVAFPVNFSGLRPRLTSAPPVLGADNDEVLGTAQASPLNAGGVLSSRQPMASTSVVRS